MTLLKQREPWYGPDSPAESKLYALTLTIGMGLTAFVLVQGLLAEMGKES